MTIPENLDDSDIFRPTTKVLLSELDDGIVMMDVDTADYLALNPVSSRIWSLIGQDLALCDIYAELRKEYQVDHDTCRSEVRDFVGDLLDRGFIEHVSAQA
ncbi:PqqD family protein [Sphingorhabdus sp. SMR4y]|uniref:PqqD family protein n=1 Tax=Sphingorhabdus sp. SMR4y TaxID=2584094 RepID=UPI000B5CC200|nr:PqqD family protein [Sphingorhabdus sp. SMR4y]ASK88437.1 coenzyme PQQ synthesis protein D (PqqD) [Sphingorhabdus sp. SMR4y]